MTNQTETSFKGSERYDENGKLISPRKPNTYNQNLRIVKRIRRPAPILSKEDLNIIIKALKEGLK